MPLPSTNTTPSLPLSRPNDRHPLPNIVDATRLTAEALAVASRTIARLTDLTNAATTARTNLTNELTDLRSTLQKRHDETTSQQAEAASRVERAAKAVAVRALETENKALQLTQQQLAFAEAKRDFEAYRGKVVAGLEARETAISAREASVRYSAVEQARLHARARVLDEREAHVTELESAERERATQLQANLTNREHLINERESAVERTLRERDGALTRREAAVTKSETEISSQRAHMLLQMETERTTFWSHQQKLSVAMSEQFELLVTLQESLRDEFQEGATFARQSMDHVRDAVERLDSEVGEEKRPRLRTAHEKNGTNDKLLDSGGSVPVGDDVVSGSTAALVRTERKTPEGSGSPHNL